ncbi:MAG: hypothetical protein A2Z77_00785 [Chloroflexi bacterium RBG_13_51_36]|nr:MAG: hypothetical protein A2Z77_00785 [Chloroflexi bacterium RBG_13_51_36]
MKRLWAPVIACLLLFVLIMPQLVVAAGPEITNVSVTDIAETSAEISWTTNTTSDSRVNYGTTTSLGQTLYNSSEGTTHNVVLTGLTQGTKYYFEVESTDISGPFTDDNGGEYYSFTTLAPATYSITLEPACGVCGDLVEVGVCGEVIAATAAVPAAGTYHICWDSAAAANVKATFTTIAAGIHTVTFFMPEAAKGLHTVHLTDNAYASKATATYEVLPSAKINPVQGPADTSVTLNVYGFAASRDIRVTLFQGAVQKGDAKTGTTNSVGSWTTTYTIPRTPAGGYTLNVEAKEGTVWVNWVSKYFEVTPKISVAPISGTVGQKIGINGTGFGSEEEGIEVTFDGEVVKSGIYAVGDGSWSTTISVPPVRAGRFVIDALGETTRARNVPDVTFTVVPGISVDPISAYIGDTIIIKGGGFAPGESGIRVYFEGVAVTSSIITANADGYWESSFELPTSTYGSHTVTASGETTQPAVTTSLSTKAELLDVSPAEGAPGDSISLTGNGFHGSQQLTVTVGGVTASGDLRTQSNGNVVISFRVPKGSTEGQRTLVVTDAGGASASVDFTVTEKTLSTTPLPVSPQDNTLRSGMVTLDWQGINGGAGYTYTVEISRTAGSGTLWSRSGVVEDSYTLTKEEALPKGTYYWRVKIVDDYGNESAWSDSVMFTVSPIPTWVWVVVGLVVLVALLVVAYRETKFKVTE